MRVTQVCAGRFHHFDLARQLVRLRVLERFISGYPSWRLAKEGVPAKRSLSYPWLNLPCLALHRLGWGMEGVQREMFWLANDTIDRFAARHLPDSNTLIAFTGCGLHAGRAAQARGIRYVCDEAGSHAGYRNRVLTEEYRHYGEVFPGIHPRLLEKTLEEYATADIITVPSEFAAASFTAMGVPRARLRKVPYGVDIRRFQKVADPAGEFFDVLFVGAVSVRKGVRHLLDAFARLQHPAKRLTIAGAVAPAIRRYLNRNPPGDNVRFLGHMRQVDLKEIMSRSHVMLVPSVEEGLALVQGQAMACGCPVVASWNSGAADLFTDGVEGFIVGSGDVQAMADRLQWLADEPMLRERMSEAAMQRVAALGGANAYGDLMLATLLGSTALLKKRQRPPCRKQKTLAS
jgi:glycosyltransferase involved in cell wall biosynthesis